MDHIKFRFVYKNPETQKYEFEFWTLQEITSGTMFEQTTHKDQEPFAVNRFTGRKDKNGKEIYEKDIIAKWPRVKPGIYMNPYALERRPVDFEVKSFFCGYSLVMLTDYQQIGNVYENPELTKTQ